MLLAIPGGDPPEISTGVAAPLAPALAAGVELLGAYRGSGYREAPGLVRRGGRTLEISPLLYLVCATIDGQRHLPEIARLVSATSGRQATAGDVSYLLEHKLAPLGLLADAGPAVVPHSHSPALGLSLRAAVLPSKAVRQVTGPLRVLFRPPLVAGVLVAWAALDVWLVTARGMGRGLGDVVADPPLVLLLAALTLLAGAFHELGHAAAARYGGADPGVIGVGIYLVWPVFYNDLNDCYRLDRAGRLRSDLGGVYFNGVFVLLLGAAYLLTGFQALVLAIAVQHLAILYQFLPFLRLDGYYVVSDLAGVPDLFSRIRPILWSLVPGRPPSPALTGLRRRARVIVTGWVVVTVPLLAALLVLLIVRLPEMTATAWSSAGAEVLAFAAAWGDGALATMALACLQIALLVVAPLGILLTLGCAVWSRLAWVARR